MPRHNTRRTSGRTKLRLIAETEGETVSERSAGRPYAKSFEKRRAQILSTAWRMIGENEGTGFSLTDLSKRANVALRTIYNAFGDKEGVIAQAVATHYSGLFSDLPLDTNDSCLLDEAVEMTARVASETARIPAWSTTGVVMYFSPKTDPRIVETLRRMPIFILKSWMRSTQADKKQIKLFGREELERSYANLQWGLVNDWPPGGSTIMTWPKRWWATCYSSPWPSATGQERRKQKG